MYSAKLCYYSALHPRPPPPPNINKMSSCYIEPQSCCVVTCRPVTNNGYFGPGNVSCVPGDTGSYTPFMKMIRNTQVDLTKNVVSSHEPSTRNFCAREKGTFFGSNHLKKKNLSNQAWLSAELAINTWYLKDKNLFSVYWGILTD